MKKYQTCHGYRVNRVSRHTTVCHAAQEAGAPHRGYIDKKKENIIFTLLYLGDPLSDWNQQSCPPTRGVYIPNLKEIAQAISEIRAAKFLII